MLFLDTLGSKNIEGQIEFRDQNAIELVLRTLLRQLVQANLDQGLPSVAINDYASGELDPHGMPLDSVRDYISKEAAEFEEIFLLVDALDQCEATVQESINKECARFLSTFPTRGRVMQSRLRPGLPPLRGGSCDVTNCQAQSILLYWECERCQKDGYYVCQACYDRDIRCLDPYVLQVVSQAHYVLEGFRSRKPESWISLTRSAGIGLMS